MNNKFEFIAILKRETLDNFIFAIPKEISIQIPENAKYVTIQILDINEECHP